MNSNRSGNVSLCFAFQPIHCAPTNMLVSPRHMQDLHLFVCLDAGYAAQGSSALNVRIHATQRNNCSQFNRLGRYHMMLPCGEPMALFVQKTLCFAPVARFWHGENYPLTAIQCYPVAAGTIILPHHNFLWLTVNLNLSALRNSL